MALAKSLGIATFNAYDTGNNVYLYPPYPRTLYTDTGPLGTAPPDATIAADIALLVKDIDDKASKINPAHPWNSPNAEQYDAQTLETYVREHGRQPRPHRSACSHRSCRRWSAPRRATCRCCSSSTTSPRPATPRTSARSSGCSTCAAVRSNRASAAGRS